MKVFVAGCVNLCGCIPAVWAPPETEGGLRKLPGTRIEMNDAFYAGLYLLYFSFSFLFSPLSSIFPSCLFSTYTSSVGQDLDLIEHEIGAYMKPVKQS